MQTVYTQAKAHHDHPILGEIYKYALVIVGGILAATGLEYFLIPNGFLDGGVVGVAILLATKISLPVGVFIGLLNIPFIVLTWRKLGKRVALRTIAGVIALSATTMALHEFHYTVTDHWSIALGYGGLLLGLGTGLALRAGGALDGVEALASILSHRSSWSVDQLILGVNVVIFIVAGFVLGWQQAMASALLFYVVVAPIIKRVVDGGSELKYAKIITDKPEDVVAAIHSQNDRRIVSHRARAYNEDNVLEDVTALQLILSRMEESILGELILEADENAIIIFSDAANVRGGIYESEGHH